MAALVKSSIVSASKGVQSVKSGVTNSLFGQSTNEKHEVYAACYVADDEKKQQKEQYVFRFAGSTGHWLALIYLKSSSHSNQCIGTVFHYVYDGVSIEENKQIESNQYQEHIIKTRSYKDILKWALAYKDNYPTYKRSDTNCRKFVIRLAEYCSVPIFEIDGQKTMGIKISSQYYSLQDTKNDVVDAAHDVSKGKVLTASGKVAKSTIKNSAKITVATVNTAVAMPKGILKGKLLKGDDD